jgi:hypothetical protein
MQWYHYFSGFWAGMFLANFVPHYIKGIAGDPFPTPFSKQPGKSLSSPLVNILWGLLNLVIGSLLFRIGRVSTDDNLSVLICFVGFTSVSIFNAWNFTNKDKI